MLEPTTKDQKVLAGYKERLPERLFRYSGVSGPRFNWFYDIIARSILFFPTYARLNDPFEGSIQVDFSSTPQRIRRYWEAWHKEQGLRVDDQVRAAIEQHVALRDDPAHRARLAATVDAETASYGVICFTESPTDKLMWSHYAESHQGICFEFRTDKLFGGGWDGCLGPIPVRYSTKQPRPSFYRASRQERTIAVVATKAREWRSEHEWRTVRYDGYGAMPFNPAALVSVTLGCRMPSADRERIVHLLSHRREVILQEAHQNEGDFGLTIQATRAVVLRT